MKRNAVRIGFGVLLAGLLLAAGGPGASVGAAAAAVGQDGDPGIAALRSALPSLIQAAHIPGLQVAVIRDGKIAWHGNYGVKSTASREPVTDDTIFEAASLTKPFFAWYVMKLVDEGLLSLDKPLVGYVPQAEVEGWLGHPLAEPGFRRDWFEKITIRHVLSHTSGMPHGEGGRPFPLYFEPGTSWKYSADGYFTVQKVIERLKGAPLDVLMAKEVLGPLGMTRSALVWRDGYETAMANGHDFFGTPADFRKRTEAHAGASLYTTAEDYAKFVCAVLNGDGLRPETLKEMEARRTALGEDKDKALGWSLGFGTQDDERGAGLWQWGDYGIFRNYVLAYPGTKSAVVYLTNGFLGVGIASEITSRAVGSPALGAAALGYPPYDAAGYVVGWEMARLGSGAASELPSLSKKHPEAFSKEGVRFLATVFQEAGREAEATAVLRFYLSNHPDSGEAQVNLAKALLTGGCLKPAAELLEAAVNADEDKVDPKVLMWYRSYARALISPKRLRVSWMRKVAGAYGARRIALRNGRLYYYRENGRSRDYRPLYALTRDMFVLQGSPDFRLKIESDKHGNPIQAVGIYDNGSTDITPRSN